MFNVGYRELFKDLTEEETLELERRRYKQHNE